MICSLDSRENDLHKIKKRLWTLGNLKYEKRIILEYKTIRENNNESF